MLDYIVFLNKSNSSPQIFSDISHGDSLWWVRESRCLAMDILTTKGSPGRRTQLTKMSSERTVANAALRMNNATGQSTFILTASPTLWARDRVDPAAATSGSARRNAAAPFAGVSTRVT